MDAYVDFQCPFCRALEMSSGDALRHGDRRPDGDELRPDGLPGSSRLAPSTDMRAPLGHLLMHTRMPRAAVGMEADPYGWTNGGRSRVRM